MPWCNTPCPDPARADTTSPNNEHYNRQSYRSQGKCYRIDTEPPVPSVWVILRQIQEQIFPTVRRLHLSTKAIYQLLFLWCIGIRKCRCSLASGIPIPEASRGFRQRRKRSSRRNELRITLERFVKRFYFVSIISATYIFVFVVFKLVMGLK